MNIFETKTPSFNYNRSDHAKFVLTKAFFGKVSHFVLQA